MAGFIPDTIASELRYNQDSLQVLNSSIINLQISINPRCLLPYTGQTLHNLFQPDHMSHPQAAADHMSHPQAAADHMSHPQAAAGHMSQPHAAADHMSQPQAAADHMSHPQAAAVHMSQPQAAVDHMSQPQAAVDHMPQPQTAVDHMSQPQAAVDHMSHPQAAVDCEMSGNIIVYREPLEQVAPIQNFIPFYSPNNSVYLPSFQITNGSSMLGHHPVMPLQHHFPRYTTLNDMLSDHPVIPHQYDISQYATLNVLLNDHPVMPHQYDIPRCGVLSDTFVRYDLLMDTVNSVYAQSEPYEYLEMPRNQYTQNSSNTMVQILSHQIDGQFQNEGMDIGVGTGFISNEQTDDLQQVEPQLDISNGIGFQNPITFNVNVDECQVDSFHNFQPFATHLNSGTDLVRNSSPTINPNVLRIDNSSDNRNGHDSLHENQATALPIVQEYENVVHSLRLATEDFNDQSSNDSSPSVNGQPDFQQLDEITILKATRPKLKDEDFSSGPAQKQSYKVPTGNVFVTQKDGYYVHKFYARHGKRRRGKKLQKISFPAPPCPDTEWACINNDREIVLLDKFKSSQFPFDIYYEKHLKSQRFGSYNFDDTDYYLSYLSAEKRLNVADYIQKTLNLAMGDVDGGVSPTSEEVESFGLCIDEPGTFKPIFRPVPQSVRLRIRVPTVRTVTNTAALKQTRFKTDINPRKIATLHSGTFQIFQHV